jgi:hypothetical protein
MLIAPILFTLVLFGLAMVGLGIHFAISSVIVGIFWFWGICYVIGQRLKSSGRILRPMRFSLLCVLGALILTTLSALPAWIRAAKVEPFVLSHKNASSLGVHRADEIVTVGADLYLEKRLERVVFRGDRAFGGPYDLFVVELVFRNESGSPIEISGSDLLLKHDNERVKTKIVGAEVAKNRLKSFTELWVGPGLPWELAIGWPLFLSSGPRDYVRARRWERSLTENEFEFGNVAPSKSRHGFVFFEMADWKTFWREGGYDVKLDRPGDWRLQVTVRHDTGKTSRYDLEF